MHGTGFIYQTSMNHSAGCYLGPDEELHLSYVHGAQRGLMRRHVGREPSVAWILCVVGCLYVAVRNIIAWGMTVVSVLCAAPNLTCDNSFHDSPSKESYRLS